MREIKDAHLENVFAGEKVPEHSKLPERHIKPWHKPRKQWIRRNQWLKKTAELCSMLNLKDRRPLRYLSLPGEDLLDIRVIQECCADRDIKLKYLGLNDDYSSDEPNTWLHIAWNEVNSLAAIHHDSVVVKDRFEQIADPNSLASKYVQDYGPFDVVNLDLCESISPIKPRQPNYYAALQSLASNQIRTRPASEPWLLLVTSRVGGPWVLDADMKKLAACIASNVETDRHFGIGLDSLVPEGVVIIRNQHTNWKKIQQPHFLNLFGVGFGKWLMQLLATASPKWGVKLLRSYSYRIYAPSPDMVSLAFLLECYPETPKDKAGLSTSVNPSTPVYDERAFALALLDGVRTINDLDVDLSKNLNAYEAMEKETYDLLLSARYSPAAIREGLKKFSRRKNGRRL
jgi:hypothetical protein